MDTGRLLGFYIQPNGDVILAVSDEEGYYAHHVTIKAQELAGIAEASAIRRDDDGRLGGRFDQNRRAPVDMPGPGAVQPATVKSHVDYERQ